MRQRWIRFDQKTKFVFTHTAAPNSGQLAPKINSKADFWGGRPGDCRGAAVHGKGKSSLLVNTNRPLPPGDTSVQLLYCVLDLSFV